MTEEIYRLWLSSKSHLISSRKQNEMLAHFGSAKDIFRADADVISAEGFTKQLKTLQLNRDYASLENLIREMDAKNIVYISREHAHFPTLLKEIPDPPVGIFYMGELPINAPNVAIIGSRRCSEYGLTATRLISKPLAQKGVTIVSGMARGVDSMAHKGAIDGGGKTIAVLGTGVDICYPPENHALRKNIIQNGCVLSEYPPGVGPKAYHFPARNRIISGLCEAIIVAEAGKKSGTLITVDTAQDQGREVLAIPGSIVSRLSEGTNKLIRDGATPVTDYTDVLAALGISYADKPEPEKSPSSALAPEEKLVYDSLTFEPTGFDELLVRISCEPNKLHFICTTLELKGLVKKLPGVRYIRSI